MKWPPEIAAAVFVFLAVLLAIVVLAAIGTGVCE